jgi:hypothetical protein
MKKGDIVYCIKDVYHDGKKIHTSGKYYPLNSSFTTYDNGQYVYISSYVITQLGFFVDGDKNYFSNWNNFSDYFITEKQVRLLKLKKINEKR